MALYHIWDVENGFAYVLHFLSLISDCLGSVYWWPMWPVLWLSWQAMAGYGRLGQLTALKMLGCVTSSWIFAKLLK